MYGPHIDALLQDNEKELDSHVWFDKPWRLPAVKASATILRLATSSEGIGTDMFLAALKALIDTSSAPDGITAHEFNARAEGVLKEYALDLAARFMAEDSKPTPTPGKTYLTAAPDLALNIDKKREQKEHIDMLLTSTKHTRTMAIAAAKAAEEMAVVNAVADAAVFA